jgi:hypothetical protein
MSVETFWTIVVYGFIFGVGALGGAVTWYWLVVVPRRVRETPTSVRRVH